MARSRRRLAVESDLVAALRGGVGMIAVRINGTVCELDDEATVDAAARAAGAPEGGRGVAVAVNGEVVPRGAWARTRVLEGQEIEVLQAVQGG